MTSTISDNFENEDFAGKSKEDMNLLKDLFSFLIENFEASYIIDGDMENIKFCNFSVEFENNDIPSKFTLSINGETVYSDSLAKYYIDQCRGGGSPFLFRNIESEDVGIAIKFSKATRFYEEYEDKKLGNELKSYAQKYYERWIHLIRNIKYWNPSQFGIYF